MSKSYIDYYITTKTERKIIRNKKSGQRQQKRVGKIIIQTQTGRFNNNNLYHQY